ncbi:hypothetical protein A0H81_04502 [Grifola frondosa]|uniref:Uncharacterized protein n=1 Tax=Grifola frondosa TaxID=5627 RepID=A0A1C7ME50_GRIFR|nr:hypothetical protein A0H81_04502 [Grifola frondosa]
MTLRIVDLTVVVFDPPTVSTIICDRRLRCTDTATVPSPEQTYAAMAPDLRHQIDATRAARVARERETEQQRTAQLKDPDSQKPVWADSSRSQ